MSSAAAQALVEHVRNHFAQTLQDDVRRLFHEAYQEAMAEGKAKLKDRMLMAILGEGGLPTPRQTETASAASPPLSVSHPIMQPEPIVAPKPVAPPAPPVPTPEPPAARIHALNPQAAPVSTPASNASQPAELTMPPPVREDDLDSGLSGQIEYIRRQIQRNEALLNQLRPFLAATGS